MRRILLLATAIALIASAALPLRAQEAPADAEERERQQWRRELAERAAEGDLFEDEGEAELAAHLRNRLLRAELDTLSASYYEMADIQLRRNQAQAAADTLRALLKRLGTRDDETTHLTRYNLARLLRLHLGDAAAAVKELKLVTGNLRTRAREELLDVLREGNQVDDAATLLKAWINAATEKPHKIALMRRMAALYREAGRDDDALAIYQKITTEVTPEEIDGWRKKIAAWVAQQTDAVLRAREADQWEKADRLEGALWQRMLSLRRQRRTDEVRAMDKALDKAEQRFEEWDRAHPDD